VTELIGGCWPDIAVRGSPDGAGVVRGMEHNKGEYLDMDEDKRQQLDQQAEEYVDDVAEQPAMNAEPAARHPADDGRASGTPEPVES